MKILAIESSCDEFSAAIIDEGQILCNVVSSQIAQHQEFGGVVPELAARLHLQNLSWVLKEVEKQTKIDWSSLDYVAYTQNPGLLGSLIIGKLVAQTVGLYLNKPVLPLNHLQGHIYGAAINHEFKYPVLVLLVSGGHTQIQFVQSPNQFQIIGSTLDDAIGEAYDKVGRVLGFNYPGGAQIDKLAQQGDMSRYPLPMPKDDDSYDFSYSGLKTAAINLLHKLTQQHQEINLPDFCASFQQAATSVVAKKLARAIEKFTPQTLTVAGGVSANSAIRKLVLDLGQKYQIPNTFVPDLEYCSDNGAMIAKLAWEKLVWK